MRIRFVGDHSGEHCGCDAVSDVIKHEIESKGVLVNDKEQYDVLVVNGEGSMHHGSRNFLQKMTEIRIAQDNGKLCYLINSVWHQNPTDFDDCLRALDGIHVRGIRSHNDLKKNHNINSEYGIDLSYFATINESEEHVDFCDSITCTDIFSSKTSFSWPSHPKYSAWKFIDMRKYSWSGLVKSLRTSSFLIAGRHHAMYAACRARIPFVPVQGNSHKFEDLLETSGVGIPIARTMADITPIIRWAKANRKAYDQLYDWMDTQPAWQLDQHEAGGQSPTSATIHVKSPLLRQAQDAFIRRDYAVAYPLWKQLEEEKGERLPYPRNACQVFFHSGDVERALTTLARVRRSKPESFIFCRDLDAYSGVLISWIQRSGPETWWTHIREAAYQAGQNNDEKFAEHFRKSQQLLDKNNPVLISCVIFLLCCRLIRLRRHDEAYRIWSENLPEGVPSWMRLQEQLVLLLALRHFDETAERILASAPKLDCWADPSFRLSIAKLSVLQQGATMENLRQIQDHFLEFPKHKDIKGALFQISSEIGSFEFFEQQQKYFTTDDLSEEAKKHIGLANYLVSHELSNDLYLTRLARLFQSIEEESDKFIKLLCSDDANVAVVGNSPVEIGQKQGQRIDSHDFVLRFNDFNLEPPYDVDYGRKTSHVIRTSTQDDLLSGLDYIKNAVIILRHGLFQFRDWDHILQLYEQGVKFAHLPRKHFLRAANMIGQTPSAGFIVAALMAGGRKSMKRKSFFGFSFTDQLSGPLKAHYFNEERPSMIHNWQREKEIFDEFFN